MKMNFKKKLSGCIAPLMSIATLSYAEGDFSGEKLAIHQDNIHVISSFDQMAFLTVYSSSGEPLWEASFSSEILSWKIKEEQVFVFSRARSGAVYFLTCIDANTGTLVWERPVFSP